MARLNHFFSQLDLKPIVDFIESAGELRQYRKGEEMCGAGEICQCAAIVRSGYFKYSMINSKGEVCVTGFSFAGEMVMDFVNSFVFGRPSYTAIAAGCESEAKVVTTNELRRYVCEHYPDLIGRVSPVLLDEAYRRYLDLHVKTPQERYVELITRCHEDVSVIPLQEMASYLSVSRRQLHRIRETVI